MNYTVKEAWELVKKQIQKTNQNKELFNIIEIQLNKTIYEHMAEHMKIETENEWLGTEGKHIKNHLEKMIEREKNEK